MKTKNESYRLVLLEVSKTKHQHSTVVDGLLRAALFASETSPRERPKLYAHQTLFERLSPEVRDFVDYQSIPVMDPQRRRLIRKTLLEVMVSLWAIMRLKTNTELLLITTLLPSTLIFLELIKLFFPKKMVVAMIHGEIEGALDHTKQRIGSFGFYVRKWLKLRKFTFSLDLAVIDNFIAKGVCNEFPNSVKPEKLYVLPLLIEKRQYPLKLSPQFTCGFIGYNTANKGYDVFIGLSKSLPAINFRTIGGGITKDVRTGVTEQIDDYDDFLIKISACDVALFPYTHGYELSLSAAAVDAIAAGTHLLTTSRPCFIALEREFGPRVITLCEDHNEMQLRLSDKQWIERIREDRIKRMSLNTQSRYDIGGVSKAIENLLNRVPFKPV